MNLNGYYITIKGKISTHIEQLRVARPPLTVWKCSASTSYYCSVILYFVDVGGEMAPDCPIDCFNSVTM